MCEFLFNLIKSLTKRKPLTVAYPEEKEGQDISSDPAYLKYLWVEKYQVKDREWGLAIQVIFDDSITNPAWTVGDVIYMQHKYANPGVLAHEVAHVVYPLIDKDGFEKELFKQRNDPKIVLLCQKCKITTIVESYAEIYRYWGNQMPESLKPFYPKLI